jgi:hypothetical protein
MGFAHGVCGVSESQQGGGGKPFDVLTFEFTIFDFVILV